MLAPSERPLPPFMLFKTLSAAVFGIDAYPADVKKAGSAFDLPMALGLAGCMGQFFGKPINKMMFLGELSLDGSIRPVRGALSAALAARESGLIALAVAEANAREAAVVNGIKIYAVKTLPQTVR